MFNKKKYKILHIFNDPKFSESFFEFLIRHNVKLDNHFLFHYRCTKSSGKNFGMRAIFAPHFFSPLANLLLLKSLFQAEKIIIHCLASPFLLFYLSLFPSLADKSYWVIWGKDLYFYKTLLKRRFYHNIYEFFRKRAIKKIRHIITFTHGDYELAKEWYQSQATWHKSFMYPSNLYKDISVSGKREGTIVILVGNSADPTNNHLEIFSLLEKFKHEDIELVVPLSYGDKKYAKQVIEYGRRSFKEKFYPIEELLPLSEYLNLLKRVEIGIFAHKRQQAMGNIITLLGMGKKVYIRNDITSWRTLKDLGVEIHDIYDFDLVREDEGAKQNNQATIKEVYSEENLLKQWNQIAAD